MDGQWLQHEWKASVKIWLSDKSLQAIRNAGGGKAYVIVKAILKQATAFYLLSSPFTQCCSISNLIYFSLDWSLLISFIHVFKNDTVYFVLGMQATAVNKKQSLFSNTLQSSGKIRHENSYFQFCVLSVLTGTNTGYHRSLRERKWDCKKALKGRR